VNDSPIGRFFGVVARPRTWTSLLFNVLAFPLGLFYFVFLVTGLSVGLGLVVVWVGIPILLLVAGAWWLFGEFERLQAHYLLGADVRDAPRAWETAEGIWGKIKAHFGSAATWKDLLYLLAKLLFGSVSFSLLATLAAIEGWLVFLPVAAIWNIRMFTFGNGHAWVPPLWVAFVAIPAFVLMLFVSLHVMNAWSWVCARWAEVLLRVTPAGPPAAPAPITPLVYTSPQPPAPTQAAQAQTAPTQTAGPPAGAEPSTVDSPPAVPHAAGPPPSPGLSDTPSS